MEIVGRLVSRPRVMMRMCGCLCLVTCHNSKNDEVDFGIYRWRGEENALLWHGNPIKMIARVGFVLHLLQYFVRSDRCCVFGADEGLPCSRPEDWIGIASPGTAVLFDLEAQCNKCNHFPAVS